MTSFALALALGSGCAPQEKQLPEKIKGLWELHQVETAGGQIDARQLVEQRYPGCTWGRMTWTFDEDHVSVGYDVLCPAATGDYYGCQVAARVPSAWDPEAGSWHIEYPAAARSRTIGRDEAAIPVPTACEVTLAAGDYQVVRVREPDWRWEMKTPEGTVYRLRLPESDRPDFVAAINASMAEEGEK